MSHQPKGPEAAGRGDFLVLDMQRGLMMHTRISLFPAAMLPTNGQAETSGPQPRSNSRNAHRSSRTTKTGNGVPDRAAALLGLILFLGVAGCVETKTLPPPRYLHDDPRLVGDFYFYGEDDRGRRPDARIRKSFGKGHYVFIGYGSDGKKIIPFRLYKIGETLFAFVDDPDANDRGSKLFYVLRVRITRTQLVGEFLSNEWFGKNPNALPGTQFAFGAATLHAPPEKLRLFLELHADTDALFNTKKPILLNRIGT